MPASLTLHSMDDKLASALRQRASEIGQSMNQTAQGLLASALGLFSATQPANDLSDCFGSLKEEDAKYLADAVRKQDGIDEEMWK